MKDFSVDSMMTTELVAREEQSYYEDVPEDSEDVIIKGAYLVGTKDSKNPTIDFFILNPRRQVIYNRRRQAEGVFKVQATIPGQYTFIFSNLKVIQRIVANLILILVTQGQGFDLHYK